MLETKNAWVVWRNTDLTEGRGAEKVFVVCDTLDTARRLGKGKGVQGGDCRITFEPVFQYNRRWYVPGDIERETAEDKKVRERREAYEAALEKAREYLNYEEIKILERGLAK